MATATDQLLPNRTWFTDSAITLTGGEATVHETLADIDTGTYITMGSRRSRSRARSATLSLFTYRALSASTVEVMVREQRIRSGRRRHHLFAVPGTGPARVDGEVDTSRLRGTDHNRNRRNGWWHVRFEDVLDAGRHSQPSRPRLARVGTRQHRRQRHRRRVRLR